MPQKDGKSRKLNINLLIIVTLPFLMVFIAWLLLATGNIPKKSTNNGVILQIETKLQDFDFKFTNNNDLTSISTPWKMIIASCSSDNQYLCDDVIYQTKQVITALGKHSTKVSRIYVEQDDNNKNVTNDNLINSLYAYDATKNLQQKLELNQWPEANIFLVDPLNRVIMQYQPQQAGKELLKDLKKLVENSVFK